MPLLTFGEVIQHIKTKKPMPVYALHGPEPYFIDLLTDAFMDQLLSEEERAFNLEVFYGKETNINQIVDSLAQYPMGCLLYTSPSPRDRTRSRMPSSA